MFLFLSHNTLGTEARRGGGDNSGWWSVEELKVVKKGPQEFRQKNKISYLDWRCSSVRGYLPVLEVLGLIAGGETIPKGDHS